MATALDLRPEQQGSRLRQRTTGPLLHRHFRVPAFVPVLGVASCVLLLTQQEGRVWLYGLGLLAVGVVLFAVARLTRGRTADRA